MIKEKKQSRGIVLCILFAALIIGSGCLSTQRGPVVATTADGYQVRCADDYAKGWEIGYEGGTEVAYNALRDDVAPVTREIFQERYGNYSYLDYDSLLKWCQDSGERGYIEFPISQRVEKTRLSCLAILKGASI